MREIEGVGVELRYYWDAELMQSFIFKDGTEVLKEAQIKRFDLEERGWRGVLTVPGTAHNRPLRSVGWSEKHSGCLFEQRISHKLAPARWWVLLGKHVKHWREVGVVLKLKQIDKG